MIELNTLKNGWLNPKYVTSVNLLINIVWYMPILGCQSPFLGLFGQNLANSRSDWLKNLTIELSTPENG